MSPELVRLLVVRIRLRILTQPTSTNSSYSIPYNGEIRPTVIDKIQLNRTNQIKLGCLIVILSVHGSLDGRTLPLHGIMYSLFATIPQPWAIVKPPSRTPRSVQITMAKRLCQHHRHNPPDSQSNMRCLARLSALPRRPARGIHKTICQSSLTKP